MPDSAQQTYLGFDFGQQRIGVAIANSITGTARPLHIVRGRSRAIHFKEISTLIETWQPQLLVVGLPLMDDPEQLLTRQARRFARQLHGRYGLPVEMIDEWGSTRQARQYVRGFDEEDHIAAAIILQRWLDEPDKTIKLNS